VPWDGRRCGLSDEIPCSVPDLTGRREPESEVADRHIPENDAASLRPPNDMSRLGSLDREGRAALGSDEVESLLGGADRVLKGRLIVGRPLRPGDNEVLAVGTRERRPVACDRPRDVGRHVAIEAEDTAGRRQRAREQTHYAMIRLAFSRAPDRSSADIKAVSPIVELGSELRRYGALGGTRTPTF
jgi:hypothetical protein